MKKLSLFIWLLFFSVFGIKAQTTQVVNLTTGTTAVGTTDPVWTVLSTPAGAAVNAIVSNGTLCSSNGGTLYPGVWATNACGRWISPHTITTAGAYFGAVPGNLGQVGNYTYRMTFVASSSCPVTSATINLTNAGADDNLSSIRINGTPFPVAGITFNPLNSLVLGVGGIVAGVNTIDVVVNNGSLYTGLCLCGNLTINYNSVITPVITGNSTFCLGDPLIFNGNASTGFIQNTFWEIAECTSSGAYVSSGGVWNGWYVGSPGTINFSTTNLGFTPQCGKYYKIKLVGSSSCYTTWTEANKIIYIKCRPTIFVQDPAPVCEGSTVTLSVSGNATSYYWAAPINQTANSVNVTANTSTSYLVTGTLNGCTSTALATTTVAPANLDVNISTGVDNNGNFISFGSNDDSWKVRGIPGTIYSGVHSALADAKVITPLTGQPAGSNWTSSANARWITTASAASGTGSPLEVAATHTDNTPNYDNWYWLESEFNLPISTYNNLRLEANEYAVDNNIVLYLNSLALSGNNTNIEYSLWSWATSMFNTLHYPGTIATNQTHYVQGTNTILAKIGNGGGPVWNGSYLGFLLNAHVKGECTPTGGHSMIQITDDEIQNERIEATTFIFPNPSVGMFTISSEIQNIQSVIVKDALGRIVKELKNINSSTTAISLENENKGFYFVEISYEGQLKPVYKKIILQ